MTKNTRFSPEVRQRAVRMVLESQGEYPVYDSMSDKVIFCLNNPQSIKEGR